MRNCILFLAATLSVAPACAKNPRPYHEGELWQMDSVQCGAAEPSKNRERLCQEYEVRVGQLVYRIRPKDDKHNVLLPIGESAHFRLEKGEMLLRLDSFDGKERQYLVMSVMPVSESTAVATPVRLNHLQ